MKKIQEHTGGKKMHFHYICISAATQCLPYVL